jgi:HAMP domain-containing protein
VVYLAVPIYRRDTHQAVGVLRSAYGASQIFGILSQFRIGRTGRALLLDRDGAILMDPIGLLHREQRVTDLGLKPEDLARPEGAVFTRDWLIAYSRVGPGIAHRLPALEERGWMLAVVQSEDEALAPVERLGRQVLLWTVVLGLLAVGLAYVASASLTRPLRELTEAAQQMGAGRLNVRVPVTSRDELGVLAETFNAMAVRLQDLCQNLERRVQEGTPSAADGGGDGPPHRLHPGPERAAPDGGEPDPGSPGLLPCLGVPDRGERPVGGPAGVHRRGRAKAERARPPAGGGGAEPDRLGDGERAAPGGPADRGGSDSFEERAAPGDPIRGRFPR